MYGLFEEKCACGCCQTKNSLRLIGQVAQLGVVPQRLPAITWREERQSDPGYTVLDINPLTGEQRYPYLRFDDRGTPFSSNPAVWQPDPRDPGIRVGMTRQLIESGLRRQAIAAQWEVDTARIQQDVGDPNARLSELSSERNDFIRYQNSSCLRAVKDGYGPISHLTSRRKAMNEASWRKAA